MSARASDMLQAIFDGCTGVVELRAIPSKARTFAPVEDTRTLGAFVKAHAKENVYFGVSARRDNSSGELANCTDLGALYADLDCKNGSEAQVRQALARCPLEPSILVHSGAGLHCYYLLKEPIPAAEAGPWLRRLQTALDGDRASAEPARVLRLPNTRNFKYTPPRPVRLEAFDPERRYTLTDFDDWLPDDPQPARTRPPVEDGALLRRLGLAGIYLRPLADRKHAVRCPWASEHTVDSGDSETIVFEPSTPGGGWGFRCQHEHCAARTVGNLYRWLDRQEQRPAGGASPRPPSSAPTPDAPPSDARLVPPPAQPMAVARALVGAHYQRAGALVLHQHRGDFYLWSGACWPEVDQRDVRSVAYQWLEAAEYLHPDKGIVVPFAPSRRKIDDVIDALKACVLIDSRLEAPVWTDAREEPPASEIVPMANGLLHVPSRRLLPHTPTFFSHHALPFAFLPDAPAPTRWLQFLEELWPEDGSSIAALQEATGYILGGDTRQQKIVLMVGPKRGGKGTFARVLTGLLGAHHVAAPTLASLATNFGLMPLIGKPLAIVSDARLSNRADTKIVVERLLSISGEDSLTLDRKFKEAWTGRLPTRFLILTNELPRLSDASGALASRFVPFVLSRSFYGAENPRLTDELLTEAPAIFNWALEGLDRLNARGYFLMPSSGAEAVQQLEDLSSPVSAFIRERCLIGPYEVEVERLWTAWKLWCEHDNHKLGTKQLFGRDLRAAVPTVRPSRPRMGTDDKRPRVYDGIGLRTE